MTVKHATARSAHQDYPVKNVIDNDPSTYYHSSDLKKYSWIQIELENESLVRLVQITNRLDCCWERLSNVEVRVGQAKVTEIDTHKLRKNRFCKRYYGKGTVDEIVVTLNCIRPISGRYVTIQILDRSINEINIADIQIFGKPKRKFGNILNYKATSTL